MEWQALISLTVFLFLSFILPFIIAMIIVVRDIRDDGHAERDARFRKVILRQPIQFMLRAELADEETRQSEDKKHGAADPMRYHQRV
ncbi:hypothetical protein [Acetobacter oeni]|nr:hypothetical protein [Acetobacter oeni]MBB3883300.1 hypothetical protein [Acetobacter oeni]NHO19531.1 hypothetical protein [Acetobacter oeni]GBR00905.1 hypothetical protein AA21952_0258 [Acetobacter oeni LMG 21952]